MAAVEKRRPGQRIERNLDGLIVGHAKLDDPQVPLFSARAMRGNIRAVLAQPEAWLTAAYTLAMQADRLLDLLGDDAEW